MNIWCYFWPMLSVWSTLWAKNSLLKNVQYLAKLSARVEYLSFLTRGLFLVLPQLNSASNVFFWFQNVFKHAEYIWSTWLLICWRNNLLLQEYWNMDILPIINCLLLWRIAILFTDLTSSTLSIIRLERVTYEKYLLKLTMPLEADFLPKFWK